MKSQRTIHDPEYAELIARLRAARRRARLSQAKVAEQLGKPQSFVSKVETCERRLDILEAIAFSRVLGVTLDSLLPTNVRHPGAVATSGGSGNGDD
jgi:transcriptional regulator with XRE-family HTH domain